MPNKDQVNTLVFDWDGTLVDSAQLGLTAFQRTFAELGHEFALDIYEAHYSPNWYSTYTALRLPSDLWERADALWLQHYGEQSAELIEGVAETLSALHTSGFRLGVVTSGSESRVTREIDVSTLKGLLDVVICNEHIVNKKPHPEGLELALNRLKSRPEETAYVGDAPEDIEMGRRGSVMTIGVKSNYPSSRRLVDSNPDLYLERIVELVEFFTGGAALRGRPFSN